VEKFSLGDLGISVFILLAVSSLFLTPIFSWHLLWIFTCYLSLNVLYTLRLKHVKWIDVLCLASFLFFRIASGSVLLSSTLHWQEVMSLMILFLALAIFKRRLELSFFIENKVSLHDFTRPYTKKDLRI
jgi:4-hydroxybenzoate polyprenyltransferase